MTGAREHAAQIADSYAENDGATDLERHVAGRIAAAIRAAPADGPAGEREPGELEPKNFENLKMHAAEARQALAKVAPPSCDDPASGGGLYYPLLFLTQTVEDTLLAVFRRAYEEVRPEIEQVEQWLEKARTAAALPSRADAPAPEREREWAHLAAKEALTRYGLYLSTPAMTCDVIVNAVLDAAALRAPAPGEGEVRHD